MRPTQHFKPQASESRLFWWSLYGFTVAWSILALFALIRLKISYLLVCVVAISLNTSNVVGYTKCQKDAAKKLQNMADTVVSHQVYHTSHSPPPPMCQGTHISETFSLKTLSLSLSLSLSQLKLSQALSLALALPLSLSLKLSLFHFFLCSFFFFFLLHPPSQQKGLPSFAQHWSPPLPLALRNSILFLQTGTEQAKPLPGPPTGRSLLLQNAEADVLDHLDFLFKLAFARYALPLIAGRKSERILTAVFPTLFTLDERKVIDALDHHKIAGIACEQDAQGHFHLHLYGDADMSHSMSPGFASFQWRFEPREPKHTIAFAMYRNKIVTRSVDPTEDSTKGVEVPGAHYSGPVVPCPIEHSWKKGMPAPISMPGKSVIRIAEPLEARAIGVWIKVLQACFKKRAPFPAKKLKDLTTRVGFRICPNLHPAPLAILAPHHQPMLGICQASLRAGALSHPNPCVLNLHTA
ncbi:uncharacterized protein MONBRDRAFT_26627 [Monosiga brevicollis MX1]|uniref:Golgi apparatus membrane protein TVP23 homolog n=1 Tax=Monosiga brevicollis TaxID=81824 RepID=A9V2X1_MONBE|nr:uncharacterized protein MONBRDRAFT_26627 [Monosiga brevicollis MX1]EDQ88088.1 predicted protein [Monosiga brevicollis MX1]|eukprot:XP_001747164.1 hypothetical protein [Monosiga brevicollis MX1]